MGQFPKASLTNISVYTSYANAEDAAVCNSSGEHYFNDTTFRHASNGPSYRPARSCLPTPPMTEHFIVDPESTTTEFLAIDSLAL